MIASAGFEAIEAATADAAIEILEARRGIAGGIHRYSDAGIDGWIESRAGGRRPLASNQDRCNFGRRPRGRNRFAQGRTILAETLQPDTSDSHVAGDDAQLIRKPVSSFP